MKSSERDDPVWKLLGKARRVEIDPFFSRNVVREVRKLQVNGEDREGVFATLFSVFRRPALAGVVAAAVVLAFVFLSTETATKFVVVVDSADQEMISDFDPTGEIESIGYLGELMDVSDPAELDDAALADLFLLASH